MKQVPVGRIPGRQRGEPTPVGDGIEEDEHPGPVVQRGLPQRVPRAARREDLLAHLLRDPLRLLGVQPPIEELEVVRVRAVGEVENGYDDHEGEPTPVRERQPPDPDQDGNEGVEHPGADVARAGERAHREPLSVLRKPVGGLGDPDRERRAAGPGQDPEDEQRDVEMRPEVVGIEEDEGPDQPRDPDDRHREQDEYRRSGTDVVDPGAERHPEEHLADVGRGEQQPQQRARDAERLLERRPRDAVEGDRGEAGEKGERRHRQPTPGVSSDPVLVSRVVVVSHRRLLTVRDS